MVQVTLAVYRRLDNRDEGLSDDSPRALELHNLRKQALHDALDGRGEVRVLDWGETDDSGPHELVTIVVGAVGAALLTGVVLPAVRLLGQKLAEKAVDEATSGLVQWIVAKLVPKQQAKQILDFSVSLPDGTTVRCDLKDGKGEIQITGSGGATATVRFATSDKGG
jgi:hypothetical protein